MTRQKSSIILALILMIVVAAAPLVAQNIPTVQCGTQLFTLVVDVGAIMWQATPAQVCAIYQQYGGGGPGDPNNWIAATAVQPTMVNAANAAILGVLKDFQFADPVLFEQSMQDHQLTIPPPTVTISGLSTVHNSPIAP